MSQILPVVESEIAHCLRQRDFYGAARVAAKAYAPAIRRHIAASFQDEQVLGDLCQASWVEICRSLETFRFQSSFLTWAKGITDHVVPRQYARYRRSISSLARSESDFEARCQELRLNSAESNQSDTNPYARAEVRERVVRVCQGLPSSEQALLNQRYFDGQSLRGRAMDFDGGAVPKEVQNRLLLRREHDKVRAKLSRVVKKLRRLWQSDASAQIKQALATLPPLQRSLVELCVIERSSLTLASEKLRLNSDELELDSLRQSLRTACSEVRSQLRKRGVLPCEAHNARLISTAELPRSGPARSLRSAKHVAGRRSASARAWQDPRKSS